MFYFQFLKKFPFLKYPFQLIRFLTQNIVFSKRLPREFGGSKIFVTSASNIRFLVPGFILSVGDLLIVAKKYIKPGQCVWDLGSNLGIFTFCAAYKAGQSGQVFSLEPNPKYSEIQNKSLQRLSHNCAPVTILCAAIADSVGLTDLIISTQGDGKNYISKSIVKFPDQEILSTKQVVTITGDFLLQHWKQPDFVKMDIEGAELLALKGSPILLSKIRPGFYIEVRPPIQAEVTELFKKYDYQLFAFSEDGKEKSIDQCAFNTIAIPAEKNHLLPWSDEANNEII